MGSKKGFTVESLTDDLVVEILSRVPFKSFCRFKCVCKAWLAFSSDSHYRQKLPKIPTGLLLQHESSIQLVSLLPNDDDIFGPLTFLPHYDDLELADTCNGLVLCQYKSIYVAPYTLRFIVCNPATREWRMLPNTQPDTDGLDDCRAILAYDPSWSAQFYVFNFRTSWQLGFGKLEVFSSKLSTWIVDKYWVSTIADNNPHIFIGGVLHVQTRGGQLLVLEGFEALSSRVLPHVFTIQFPDERYGLVNGCFGQSSGLLQGAFPEEGGRRVAVWSLDTYRPCKWSLKHRISMEDAFGSGYFDRTNMFSWWRVGYRILALESEFIFIIDTVKNKLLSYNISNGKLSEIQIQYGCRPYLVDYYYVACYSKLQV